MNYWIVILFTLFYQLAHANFICSLFLEPERSFNLTERATELNTKSVEEIINDSDKTWVVTRHNEYRAYKFIPGRKDKPLFIFLMGLGGSIEESMHKDRIVKAHIRKGHPVLLLEGAKLGDTAIIAARTKFKSNFKKNMEGYEDLLSIFLKDTKIRFSDITLAGHSYGAYGASHLATKIHDIISNFSKRNKKFNLTLQLFAPAVTNFNNRFNPNWLNTIFEGFSNYLDLLASKSGYNIQVKEVAKAMQTSIPELIEDPFKLHMSSELTVDAGNEHILSTLKHLPKNLQVQLFLASEEGFLFPMLHYELYQGLISLGLETVLFEVQGPDHFITDNLSKNQAGTTLLPRIDKNFDFLNTYYSISTNGRKSVKAISDLELKLKIKSMMMWNDFVENQNTRYVYFGAMPIKDINSFYPKEWR